MLHASPLDAEPAGANPAAALQRLYVGLLFRERLRQRWLQDRPSVLREYGLPDGAASCLPDIASPEFRNEYLGRRLLIARELQPRFTQTLAAAYGVESIRDLGNCSAFSSFLESAHFLTTTHCLPHPYGMGRGYENSSKFFLWLRDVELAAQPQLRLPLHQDFAVHLVRQSPHCAAHPLVLARKGVLFRAKAHSDDEWFLVDKSLRVLKFQVQDLPAFLSGAGFFLDHLDPAGNYAAPAAQQQGRHDDHPDRHPPHSCPAVSRSESRAGARP